jgi:hypothetical protein
MPLQFDRESYLNEHEIYETRTLNDVGWELSEFNGDPESIAYELAYSRYRIAQLEKTITKLDELKNEELAEIRARFNRKLSTGSYT